MACRCRCMGGVGRRSEPRCWPAMVGRARSGLRGVRVGRRRWITSFRGVRVGLGGIRRIFGRHVGVATPVGGLISVVRLGSGDVERRGDGTDPFGA